MWLQQGERNGIMFQEEMSYWKQWVHVNHYKKKAFKCNKNCNLSKNFRLATNVWHIMNFDNEEQYLTHDQWLWAQGVRW